LIKREFIVNNSITFDVDVPLCIAGFNRRLLYLLNDVTFAPITGDYYIKATPAGDINLSPNPNAIIMERIQYKYELLTAGDNNDLPMREILAKRYIDFVHKMLYTRHKTHSDSASSSVKVKLLEIRTSDLFADLFSAIKKCDNRLAVFCAHALRRDHILFLCFLLRCAFIYKRPVVI
jgi:hypothetical protein